MFDRRQVLETCLIGGSCFAAQACSSPFFPPKKIPLNRSLKRFPQGLASADPQPDGVVLWTRCEPLLETHDSISLIVELSENDDFSQLVLQQQLSADKANDYTIRFYASGLKPDTQYFYRFYSSSNEVTQIGMTHTAPPPNTSREVRFAWASCQDYEAGFYNGWKRLLADDARAASTEKVDFIVHVGDFIYESIHAKFADEDTRAIWGDEKFLTYQDGGLRKLPTLPSGGSAGKYGGYAAIDLQDFRHLYKEYLKDPHLQAARARWPFICIWDDHEFTDNAWQSQAGTVSNQLGRLAANQAWFEYIPVLLTVDDKKRTVFNEPKFGEIDVKNTAFGEKSEPTAEENADNQKVIKSLKIYRKLQFGSLLSLIITDNRLYRSDHVIPEWWVKENFKGLKFHKTSTLLGQIDGEQKKPTVQHYGVTTANPRNGEPSASILGKEQKQWFKRSLDESNAAWKIWINSVPLTPLYFRQDGLASGEIPITLHSDDAWDGYPTEKAELLKYIGENKLSNVVSLSGDYHAHIAGNVVNSDQIGIMPEFAVTAISSVSLYRVLRLISPENSKLRDEIIGVNKDSHLKLDEYLVSDSQVNPQIEYADTNSNGYGIVEVNSEALSIKLITLGSALIDYPLSEVPIKHIASFEVLSGDPSVTLIGVSKQ